MALVLLKNIWCLHLSVGWGCRKVLHKKSEKVVSPSRSLLLISLILPHSKAWTDCVGTINFGRRGRWDWVGWEQFYSISIVPGGLLVRSYITLLTPFTSFTILVITF